MKNRASTVGSRVRSAQRLKKKIAAIIKRLSFYRAYFEGDQMRQQSFFPAFATAGTNPDGTLGCGLNV